LLARAAAYAKHRSQYSTLFDYRTMMPLIAGPPFVRALQELAAATKHGPAAESGLTPADTARRIHDGECAMAIGWLANTHDWPAATVPGRPQAIGVIPLPGSRDVYNFRSESWEQRGLEESPYVPLVGISGRLGSLTQECRQTATSARLLLWVSGPEMSPSISASSPATGPFRQAHVAHINQWTGARSSAETAREYAEAIQKSLDEPNCLIGLRIPGRVQYLQSLAESVRATITGQLSAEAALANAAKKWQGITESLGLDKQRAAYTRSIGMRPPAAPASK
jgi:multiple sugar transport system substrate-binding protein